ncbi:Dihydrolipoyllysine-residue succinyltransferase component of 2-oxoglutarate dehydrogenase complex [Buchnera aphidicola (Thelaxes suberi)]|uniref:dihydrolipoyllysine-residue succinyltransferase n=1 Tax=Buchnera aphidicola TaxID=9 RepID=UPI00346450AE
MNNQLSICCPILPESVINGTISKWYKQVGDAVKYNEVLLDLETDKVILEIPASNHGILLKILKKEGDQVTSNEILGYMSINISNEIKKEIIKKNDNLIVKNNQQDINLTPSARRLIQTYDLDLNKINKEYRFNKINSAIIEKYIRNQLHQKIHNINNIKTNTIKQDNNFRSDEMYQRKKMSSMRQKICERLLQSVHNAVMLTTFQEINMSHIIKLRKKYNIQFQKKYSIKLGFMSFYVKAITECLKNFPEINASIDGSDIIYYKYFDISIAIATTSGLVTPVLKSTDKLSMYMIENKIKNFADKANVGKLKIKDLIGGNITISNGGVFGSLFSTPIINPPQSAILGIHAIQNRAVVIDNEIKIMPMMYAALTYDHRIVDGKDAISFLKMFKNIIEDYSRIIINI